MMSSSLDRVTDIDVGTPPYPQEWETVRVHFHNFKVESIDKRNYYIKSEEFDCCGTKWNKHIRL